MNMINNNSYIIWILLVISVIALAIILERFFFFFKFKTERDNLVNDIKEILTDIPSAEKVKMASQLCSRSMKTNPLAMTLKQVLENVHQTKTELENLVEIEIQKQITHFERFLTTLNTISTISPLLGLLGTVIGMIRSFLFISQGNLEQSSVASGISEALITTAIGLIIAIPATVAYNFYVRKTDKIFKDVAVGSAEIIKHLK